MIWTEVYRAYDADDRLLYVGCTRDLEARLYHHRLHSPWFPFHAYIDTEPYPSRAEARAAETHAIATEHPRWNVKDRSPDHPDGPISMSSGRFAAPWLREEIEQWRHWLNLTQRRAA